MCVIWAESEVVWMDFDQLYKEQFPVVYRYLTGLCGNQALAEELTQETFCRAIEHSASFKENAGCPYGCAKSERTVGSPIYERQSGRPGTKPWSRCLPLRM